MILSIEKNKKSLSEISILDDDLMGGGEVLIGRESDCHVCLDSFQISRYHAVLKLNNEKICVENLSDYGKVIVNGVEIKEAKLSDGDKIDIGEYSIVIASLPARNENAQEGEDLDSSLERELEVDAVEENSGTGGLEVDESDFLSSNIEEEAMNIEADHTPFEDEDQGAIEFNDEVEGLNNDMFLDDAMEEKLEDNLNFDSDISDTTEEDEFNTNSFDKTQESDLDDNIFGESEFETQDSFEDELGSGDRTEVFSTFAKYSLKIIGKFAPFDLYNIEDGELFIGRDTQKCQIVLEDDEVSKVHAVIKKTKISCVLKDLDSSNGLIYNGERVNKAELVNGDKFIIGETTFIVEIHSDIIEAEQDILMPVEENQEVEIEEVVEEEVDFGRLDQDGGFDQIGAAQEKSLIKRIMNDPKKKRMAIILSILFVAAILLPDEKPVNKVAIKDKKKSKKKEKEKPKFNQETLEKLEQNYALADAKFNNGELYLAKEYIDIVMAVDPNYRNSQTLSKLIQEGLDSLVKLKAREDADKERRERQFKVASLVEKAKKAVAEKKVELAKGLFNQIFELEPENIDVPLLKLEIEAYEKDIAKKKQEKELERSKRQQMVDKLKPGKSLYLKKEWYKAVDKLEKFLIEKNIDEDLIKEATKMLETAKRSLLSTTGPLLSKARSFREGQDLKQAYETYGDVLKYNPTHEEALNERDRIFMTLENRSKKIYREALVAESLSLFSKAKEKLQEVQQISPINSEYYNKASEKLKEYLE